MKERKEWLLLGGEAIYKLKCAIFVPKNTGKNCKHRESTGKTKGISF